MKRTVYLEWVQRVLRDLAAGHPDASYENPGLPFTREAKAGRYDALSDETYAALLADTEELAEAWQSRSRCTSAELFRAFWQQAAPGDEEQRAMAELLAGARERQAGAFSAPDLTPIGPRRDPALRALCHPRAVYRYLADRVCGQRPALQAAAMLLCNHMNGRRRNLLFLGPTGCGKTEIWRVLSELYPNIRIVDSTVITLQGWAGSFKLRDVFQGMDRETAERAILVFDEFDKLCEPKYSSGGSNSADAIQSEMLKLLEGGRVLFPEERDRERLELDTSRISFVFCGSFERLAQTRRESGAALGFGGQAGRPDAFDLYRQPVGPEDLVRYGGVRQEIAGRIQQIVALQPMTAEGFRAILANANTSPLHRLEQEYGVTLTLDEPSREALIQDALRTRLGVRYLQSRLQQRLDEALFRDWGRTEYDLSAAQDCGA